MLHYQTAKPPLCPQLEDALGPNTSDGFFSPALLARLEKENTYTFSALETSLVSIGDQMGHLALPLYRLIALPKSGPLNSPASIMVLKVEIQLDRSRVAIMGMPLN